MQSIHDRALEAARIFKKAESELIDIIQDIDFQKRFREKNFTSTFDYCVKFLKLSEATSYTFISLARKSREVPELKTAIQNDLITVSNAKKLVSVITKDNKDHWLSLAQSLPKAKLEREIAKVSPQLAVKEKVKFVSESRLKLELGVSESVMNDFKRAQEILMQKTKGRVTLEEVLRKVLEDFLQREDPLKKAQRAIEREKVKRSSTLGAQLVPGPVQIPFERTPLTTHLRHQLAIRDHAQCGYADQDGKRCPQRKWLQIHHVIPVSHGGQNQLENLKTLCFAHHQMIHQ